MHRTQVYLQDELYQKLKNHSHSLGVSVSELIRRTLLKEVETNPAAEARAFFERLIPLESFATTEPETYVRELRSTSRFAGRTDDLFDPCSLG